MKFEDIRIGMSESYSQTITDADIKLFSGISGDKNPIHMSDEYAERSTFKVRIAHGLISAGFFSAIFGTKLPGPGCVYVHQDLTFRKPVYLNDTVTATVTVTDIDIEKRRIFFRTICKVKAKIVISGNAELFQPNSISS